MVFKTWKSNRVRSWPQALLQLKQYVHALGCLTEVDAEFDFEEHPQLANTDIPIKFFQSVYATILTLAPHTSKPIWKELISSHIECRLPCPPCLTEILCLCFAYFMDRMSSPSVQSSPCLVTKVSPKTGALCISALAKLGRHSTNMPCLFVFFAKGN